MKHQHALLLACLMGTMVACADEPEAPPQAWQWNLPAEIPAPKVPEDNPMSPAKVKLGRMLFYDVRLSGNETQSCGSCHQQKLAFTDGLAQAKGSTGEIHPRSSMGLTNIAYASVLAWADNKMFSLEKQALVPMFGTNPVELGLANKQAELIARLEADEFYPSLFKEAFPNSDAPITLENITNAIAAFERTLISFNAPYDRFIAGDKNAMSPAAQRGMKLFLDERTDCHHCHGGINFSDATTYEGLAFDERPFHNTGLYALDEQGTYPEGGTGLYELTGKPRDMGRFKAPTLRNIEVTAPYMHDGSIATLEAVIDHYARGGTLTENGPNKGDGAKNPYKSEFVPGFTLTEEEKSDLIAFLKALTDQSFLTNSALSDPFDTQ